MDKPVCHVLWFRQTRKEKWRAVFSGVTSRDCFDALTHGLGLQHGEWPIQAGNRPPRNVDLTRPRKQNGQG